MTVRVLIFGVLADRLGRRDVSVDLPAAATVAALLDELAQRHEAIAAMRGNLAVAVNMAYARPADELREHDEVAIIPPVSGG